MELCWGREAGSLDWKHWSMQRRGEQRSMQSWLVSAWLEARRGSFATILTEIQLLKRCLWRPKSLLRLIPDQRLPTPPVTLTGQRHWQSKKSLRRGPKRFRSAALNRCLGNSMVLEPFERVGLL